MLQGNISEFECGLDEVGRGCLAGPVVAAAVILPIGYKHEGLNDSKKISEKKRIEFAIDIKRDAIAWAVAEISPQEIDKVNILKASFYAMHKAMDKLDIAPQFLAVDGNRFIPYKDLPFECVVKGDSKKLNIAAASILAKTYRDDLMKEYSKEFPGYGWERNAGYPTKEHRAGIEKIGISPIHRITFKLLPDQVELFQ
jgi:ribonuclease HII